jgi:hypothetical protein
LASLVLLTEDELASMDETIAPSGGPVAPQEIAGPALRALQMMPERAVPALVEFMA